MIPTLIALERSYNTVFLAFDRDITRVSGILPWDNGFVLTVNGVPTAVTPAKVANGIWFTTGSNFADGDTIALAYSGVNLCDVVTITDLVAAFATTTAPLFWNGPADLTSIVPEATPTKLVLTFRSPVASLAGDLKAALVLTINSISVDLTLATVVSTGRTVTLTMTSDFAYNSTIALTYTPGDWYFVESNTLVPGFTTTAIKSSLIGTNASGYPSSSILANPLSITGNVVTASFTVSLNSIDRTIVTRYAPTFDQGGAFGLPTVSPPAGYFVPGSALPIQDGKIYSYTFTIVSNTPWAVLAATDWLNTMVVRLGVSLNAARATDQSISLGVLTITQV